MRIKLILSIWILASIWTFSACQNASSLKDTYEIQVNYKSPEGLYETIETITSKDQIIGFTQDIGSKIQIPDGFRTDLVYSLNYQTPELIKMYQVSFDLKQQLGIAQDGYGTYDIPFEWVNSFLMAKPLTNHFTDLAPPTLELRIGDHQMILGLQQTWSIEPTKEVSYPMNKTQDTYETYPTNEPSIPITGLFSHRQPDHLSLIITSNDLKETYDDIDLNNLPSPETSGLYTYMLTALWNNPMESYTGQIDYTFGVNLHLKEVVTLNSSSYEPGDCIAVLVEGPKGLNYRLETPTYDKTIGLFYRHENLIGLIPLSSKTKPGTYQLLFYEDSTNSLLETLTYQVTEKAFESQQLTVSSSTASIKSQENYALDAEKFKNAKAFSVGNKLWDGTFLQPVQGRISTEYAVIRYVNGGGESSRHSGIDIAAPQGTPIVASNNGIVTFASDLIVTGNTIVIDHGYGLFSSYLHLYKLNVVQGQEVKKGDIIGEVGSTGYSTGPHLHWTIWKNGVYLNPWKFIDSDPLEFAN